MLSSDYVMTIDSDDEIPTQSMGARDEVVQLDTDFTFDPFVDALTETWDDASDLRDLIKTGSRPVRMSPVCSMCTQCSRIRIGASFCR